MTDFEKELLFGIYDEDGNAILPDDSVSLLGRIGLATVECGALGIAFEDGVDWDAIRDAIEPAAGCRNPLTACQNDDFVSFWELAWNFGAGDGVIPNVRRIRRAGRDDNDD